MTPAGFGAERRRALLEEHLVDVSGRPHYDPPFHPVTSLDGVFDQGRRHGRHDACIDYAGWLLEHLRSGGDLDSAEALLRSVAARDYAKPPCPVRSIWGTYQLGQQVGRHDAYIDYARHLLNHFFLAPVDD